MIYASTPPINDDPTPWLSMGGRMSQEQYEFRAPTERHQFILKPRPEFERPRAHEANPVLVAFREEIESGAGRERYSWGAGCMVAYTQREATAHVIGHFLSRMAPMGSDPQLLRIAFGVDASRAQIDHARRVLTRLAKMKED